MPKLRIPKSGNLRKFRKQRLMRKKRAKIPRSLRSLNGILTMRT